MNYKMKITALGTGSFSSLKYFNTSLYIDSRTGKPSDSLLIDAGNDIKYMLAQQGMSPEDIYNIFITHRHSDHIGGIGYICLMNYFNPDAPKPRLISTKNLLIKLWKGYLKCELTTLAEHQLPKDKKNRSRKASFKDFYTPIVLNPNAAFTIGGIKYLPVQTLHVTNGGEFMDSHGLVMECGEHRVLYTGDTQYTPNQLQGFMKDATVIITDCETSENKSGIHAHWSELIDMSEDIKRKTWFIHFGDEVDEDYIERAKAEGFLGFLRPGQELILE
jgi:ribonuclease BN (tRNA processing enzyme)